MFGADVYACRFEADVDAVGAVIAFGRRVIVGVHVDRVVRAGLRARFAADAAAVVKINDSVLACKQRRHRTDLDARRIGAVIAAHHAEQPSRIGKLALLDVFDPSAVHADRHLVLGLTCHGARVAADTLSVVDDKAVVHGLIRF